MVADTPEIRTDPPEDDSTGQEQGKAYRQGQERGGRGECQGKKPGQDPHPDDYQEIEGIACSQSAIRLQDSLRIL
jgi:hypothetical protein